MAVPLDLRRAIMSLTNLLITQMNYRHSSAVSTLLQMADATTNSRPAGVRVPLHLRRLHHAFMRHDVLARLLAIECPSLPAMHPLPPPRARVHRRNEHMSFRS